jgi:hypothetical protein
MGIESRAQRFAVPLVWGLIVLISWIGWGDLAARVLFAGKRPRPDVGLRAGWGMCLTIFYGGLLNAAGACGPVTIGAWVIVGALLAVIGLVAEQPSWKIPAGYWPVILIAAIVYAGSVCWRFNWNEFDDYLAYAVYPLKMVQSGAALDPFSWRRLSTVGGYSFLQACVELFGRAENSFQTDIGLGGIMACLVTIPMLRRAGASPLFASLPAIVCLTVPLGRINSMSYCLGLAGFLLLFRTAVYLEDFRPGQRRGLCVLAGVVASALTTIRPNFLPVAGLMLLISEMIWVYRRKISATGAAGELILMAIGGVILFAPWSVALHAAAGSWFYPVFPGNQQRVVDIFSRHLGAAGFVKFAIGFFLRPKMLVLMALGAIALGVSNAPAKAMWIAAIIGAVMVVSRFSTSDAVNLTRYTLPSLAAATVAAWMASQLELRFSPVAVAGKFLLVGAAVALAAGSLLSSGSVMHSLKSINQVVVHNDAFLPDQDAGVYASAQRSIPAGASVLTLVDYPFLLDYRRNRIDSADWPAMASPPPGMPLFQGPEALARYLKSVSIEYLLVTDFEQDQFMYSARYYRSPKPEDIIGTRTASRALDMFQNINALAAMSPPVFDQGGLRVLRVP